MSAGKDDETIIEPGLHELERGQANQLTLFPPDDVPLRCQPTDQMEAVPTLQGGGEFDRRRLQGAPIEFERDGGVGELPPSDGRGGHSGEDDGESVGLGSRLKQLVNGATQNGAKGDLSRFLGSVGQGIEHGPDSLITRNLFHNGEQRTVDQAKSKGGSAPVAAKERIGHESGEGSGGALDGRKRLGEKSSEIGLNSGVLEEAGPQARSSWTTLPWTSVRR